jgi:hypothetical protein
MCEKQRSTSVGGTSDVQWERIWQRQSWQHYYNLSHAMAEYNFIKPDFIPVRTRVDINDYEGGIPDNALPGLINVSLPIITEPFTGQPPTALTPTSLGHSINMLWIKLSLPSIVSAIGMVIHGTGFQISIPATRLPTIVEQKEIVDDMFAENEKEASINDDDNEKEGRCTFFYCEAIISMMERHYCAHTSTPGSSPPDPKSIKKWAVQHMYDFCMKHERPKVWVYFWENWYRAGRWELWARSAHKLISVLKTTMILESQYVKNHYYNFNLTYYSSAGNELNTTSTTSTCHDVTSLFGSWLQSWHQHIIKNLIFY